MNRAAFVVVALAFAGIALVGCREKPINCPPMNVCIGPNTAVVKGADCLVLRYFDKDGNLLATSECMKLDRIR